MNHEALRRSDRPIVTSVHSHGASPYERECAERAGRAVKGLYRDLGFEYIQKELPDVFFMDTISVGSKQIDWALAIYDRQDSAVRVCRYRSDIFQNNERFDGCSRRAVYYTIIVHEFAHYINAMISPGLPPAVDEAIAGFVQYTLMDPVLRDRLLEETSGGFGSYRDAVLSRYISDPDDFLGSAYLYLREHPSIMKRWLLRHELFPKDPLFL